MILDNLEAVAPEPLRQLLDAAVNWSEAGGSRVLCTTRTPDFNHPHYRVEGTRLHRRIALEGLGRRAAPDDALEWFAELQQLPPAPSVLPPAREALIELFDQVRFHPLSIRVLAQQLKMRRPAELGQRLEQLLTAGSAGGASATTDDTPPELVASLQLSLDRLDDTARQVLPRLGVFQGGAWEHVLLKITEIGEAVWPALRAQLEAAALLEAEPLPGVNVPFLRFHPTLAPLLWAQLSADQQARLSAAHRQRYYALANSLYHTDRPASPPSAGHRLAGVAQPAARRPRRPGRWRAGCRGFCRQREPVPGLSSVFHGKPKLFSPRAQAAAGEPGSEAWVLAQFNRGEQLFNAGRVAEAAAVFRAVLATLGDAPSYKRAMTLCRLGRCFRDGCRPDLAAQHQRAVLAVLEHLEPTDNVKQLRAGCLTDLADALVDQGHYAEARQAYADGLKVAEEQGDLRGQGVILAQLGTLALKEGNLDEAAERYRALALFQQLREPEMEAVAWHQLGMVFEKAQRWDKAERHYRESARIEEQQGNLAGAARTWNSLAGVSVRAEKLAAAEQWCRKAIEGFKSVGDKETASGCLSNLAGLLRNLPGRLTEARQLAEEALAIQQSLDPGTVAIWNTYHVFAKITEQEAATAVDSRLKAEYQTQACDYRRLARDAKRNFPGTRHELRRHAKLIAATVAACAGHPEARERVANYQEAMRQAGPDWAKLAAVLDRILAGERDEDALRESLGPDQSMVLEAILHGLANPATLDDLFPDRARE